MTGAEYLTADALAALWSQTDRAFDVELAQSKLSVQDFLKGRHPTWNLVGRVHFNLVENRRDEECPFPFLATYTTKLSAQGAAPAARRGVAGYAGAKNRARLLSLLTPVQRAAEQCAWLKAMADTGEISHPLRWGPQGALQFLKDAPALEAAGAVVRMPVAWRMNRPARAARESDDRRQRAGRLGLDALLNFRMEVTLDGEALTKAEIKRLFTHLDGPAFICGQWLEVDHERLGRTLSGSRRSSAAPPRRACRSARRCAFSPARPLSGTKRLRQSETGVRLSPGYGWGC